MTTAVTHPSTIAATSRWGLLRRGAAAGAVAAIAVTLTVVVARAAGVDLAIDGEQIPLLAFAQLTLVGALVGVGLARLLARHTRRARTNFVRVTAALTALSIVPDLAIDAPASTKVVLAATHVLAAFIIVPSLNRRLGD